MEKIPNVSRVRIEYVEIKLDRVAPRNILYKGVSISTVVQTKKYKYFKLFFLIFCSIFLFKYL